MVSRKLQVVNPTGLHLRPAGIVCQAAMKFKYKFSNTLKILFVAIYVLAVVCFTWNLIRLFNSLTSEIALDTYKYISLFLCLLLPIVI
jgi:hypothetical protein